MKTICTIGIWLLIVAGLILLLLFLLGGIVPAVAMVSLFRFRFLYC